jgi:hypothetical protein
MSALWKVSSMLAFNHSIRNRKQHLQNVLKALVLITLMWILNVIFISKIIVRYFTLLTKGMFDPFNIR